MAKLLGLDKIAKLMQIIKQNGGIRKSMAKVYRMDELKDGKLVGIDKYGNKYFENTRYFYGRNRWVEYAPKYGMDYDGSQIPAEWYGWMHYKTDMTPDQDPTRPKYAWMADHTQNFSGTSQQYVPYSTTPQKIHTWDSKSTKNSVA